MKNKIYVGNIEWSVTDQELENFFNSQGGGGVVSATVITDRETGRSKGFGFVEFETEENATFAVQELHGSQLNGRPIKVNIAKDNGGGGNSVMKAIRRFLGEAELHDELGVGDGLRHFILKRVE